MITWLTAKYEMRIMELCHVDARAKMWQPLSQGLWWNLLMFVLVYFWKFLRRLFITVHLMLIFNRSRTHLGSVDDERTLFTVSSSNITSVEFTHLARVFNRCFQHWCRTPRIRQKIFPYPSTWFWTCTVVECISQWLKRRATEVRHRHSLGSRSV